MRLLMPRLFPQFGSHPLNACIPELVLEARGPNAKRRDRDLTIGYLGIWVFGCLVLEHLIPSYWFHPGSAAHVTRSSTRRVQPRQVSILRCLSRLRRPRLGISRARRVPCVTTPAVACFPPARVC